VLDGVFIAVHRRVWEKHHFDFKTFDGFHGYDLDFSRRATDAGARFAVPLDLLLLHRSTGRYGGDWRRYAERFRRAARGSTRACRRRPAGLQGPASTRPSRSTGCAPRSCTSASARRASRR
jgi:hypothetical protein